MDGGGVKLPLLIANSVCVKGLRKGKVRFNCPVRAALVKFGFGGSLGIAPNSKGYFILGLNSTLIFGGKADFSRGISLRIDDGICKIGNNFGCNSNCFISVTSSVMIQDNVIMGWGVTIRDSDGHHIGNKNQEKPSLKPVFIGKHVWVAANASILKGSIIGDDCVVGAFSVVLNEFPEPNCIVAGFPARIVQHGISWRE